MSISPWYVTQTRPVWAITQTQDAPETGGSPQPLNITGSTITLHYKATDSSGNPTGSDIPGTNPGVITDGLAGQFTYTPAAVDTFVTTAGIYIMMWKFDYGSGSIAWSDPFQLEVTANV
jgi:hypothetical protein